MMKSLLLAILLFKMADAGVRIFPKEDAPAGVPYEPGCWSSMFNQYISKSLSPIGSCKEYVCQDNGDITELSCGSFVGNCDIIQGDSSKSYPDCCPTINCQKGQSGYGVA